MKKHAAVFSAFLLTLSLLLCACKTQNADKKIPEKGAESGLSGEGGEDVTSQTDFDSAAPQDGFDTSDGGENTPSAQGGEKEAGNTPEVAPDDGKNARTDTGTKSEKGGFKGADNDARKDGASGNAEKLPEIPSGENELPVHYFN